MISAKDYDKVPQTLKALRNWVCYKVVRVGGKDRKLPIDPSTRKNVKTAKADDPSTWGDFREALHCAQALNLDGLGLELEGSGVFAIDISSNVPEKLADKDFKTECDYFSNGLDSYSEWSPSGNGLHILCRGSLPEGKAEKGNAKAMDKGFIAVTGKCYRERTAEERTKEFASLWLNFNGSIVLGNESPLSYEHKFDNLSEEEIREKLLNSPKTKYAMEGDLSAFGNDRERAERFFAARIAVYANLDADKINRVMSSLSFFDKEKWEKDGHGEKIVQEAIDRAMAAFVDKTIEKKDEQGGSEANPVMNVDEDGEPIFRLAPGAGMGKEYALTDTGNAERFYDCFGDLFHYNATDKCYMFWTGKTWIYDIKNIIRKYANEFLRIIAEERDSLSAQKRDTGDEYERKKAASRLDECNKNLVRLSNKAGKDAMLNELQSLGRMPVESGEFNRDPYLLNTDSGIVDLRTGQILPFDREKMMSSNTHTKVSYEEPKTWLAFLHSIFERGNEEETNEIVECLRRVLGYTLTGLVTEQVMFLLHGSGSNGKSTLAFVLQNIMGDYYKSIDSSQLMVQKNQNVSLQYSLAELQSCRYLVTQETDVGAKLSESVIKQITGGDPINAQKKYGRPFQFNPTFKVFMMTNNLPIIRGTDYGIWRRIFLFPFKKKFKDGEKDKSMPEKLAAEYPQILGWCIKGAVDYLKDRDLKQPKCLLEELSVYQKDMDVISKFLSSECKAEEGEKISKNELYQAFKSWSLNNNEYALPESRFRDEIIKKGFPCRTEPGESTLYYHGIALNVGAKGLMGGFNKGYRPIHTMKSEDFDDGE